MSGNSLGNNVNVILLCRFLRILFLLSGITLITACQVTHETLTPIPSTTPTSTASETAARIPDPTDTPHPTAPATLTPTPPSTPDPTNAPTPTETPVPVEMPQIKSFIFQDDFNDGFDNGIASRYHWNKPSLNVYGAKLDLVQDPTESQDALGRDRGIVMRVINEGDPVPIPGWSSTGFWRAAYPGWIYFNENGDGYKSLIPQSAGMQVDAWIDPNIGTVSLLGGHRISVEENETSVVALEVHNNTEIVVLARDDKGNDHRVNCIDGLYRPGEWNTFTIIVDIETGRVLPFINGEFALSSVEDAPRVPVNENLPGAFSDAHAGVNCWSPTKISYTNEGTVVLNDNFIVFIPESVPSD